MKSEPDVYSFEDLRAAPGGRTNWEGVRNYQARNFMRDRMKVGDPVLFYHSSCAEPGIPGLAEVSRPAEADLTAQDPDSPYYDPKATSSAPRWWQVEVRFVRPFPRLVTLRELRAEPALTEFALLRKGNRLSILPVEATIWKHICRLAGV